MENVMQIAIRESLKASRKGDIPVGAIILKDNKIIAKSYNKKEKKQISTRHAEIEVIEKACKKLKSWHLDNCEIYVTMEPCSMCYNAIIQSRIKKLVYGVNNQNYGHFSSEKYSTNYNIEIVGGVLASKIKKILKDFFKQMRKEK